MRMPSPERNLARESTMSTGMVPGQFLNNDDMAEKSGTGRDAILVWSRSGSQKNGGTLGELPEGLDSVGDSQS